MRRLELMRASAILDALPPEYLVEEGPRGLLAAHRDARGALRQAGYGLQADGDLRPSQLPGRKPLCELPTRDETFLVRRFSHGGLLRFFTRARFLDPRRPFDELRVSHALARAGVRTPEVIAARALSVPGGGFHLDLVTRRVEDSIDLGFFLGMARRGEIERGSLRRLAAAAGMLVRQLHETGCLHADLTPNNILVNREAARGAEPRLWIVDLDRARLRDRLSDGERRANLRRLFRFVARREERDGRALSRSDHARFMLGYDPGGLAWKADWRAIESEHARRRAWHAVGWSLEHLFARSRDPRESLPEDGPRLRARPLR